MARVLEARAVISATDKTGATFSNIAAKMKGLERAASSLRGGKAPLWGDRFQKDIDRLRLSERDLDRVRASWDRLHATMRGGGPIRAADWVAAQERWKASTLTGLRAVRGEMDATSKAGMLMTASMGRLFALAGGVYGLQRAGRFAWHEGAVLAREEARNWLAGMTPQENDAAGQRARRLSTAYPSVDQAQILERYRNLRSFGGSAEAASAMIDDHIKGLVVLQSIKGRDQAMSEMPQFLRGLDILGRNESPKAVSRLLNAYLKGLAIDSDLNMREFAMMARYSKSAGATLSEEFLGAIAPTFMQDIGGARFGTMLGSMVAQTTGGRASKSAKAYQTKVGLRGGKGDMVDADLLLSNPYDWAQKYIPDAMRKVKMDPGKESDVVKFMSKLFSNQLVADFFNKLITQADQAERNRRLYGSARGLDAADDLKNKDPFVALEGFFASVRNLAAVATSPQMESAAATLNRFAETLNNTANAISGARDFFGSEATVNPDGTVTIAPQKRIRRPLTLKERVFAAVGARYKMPEAFDEYARYVGRGAGFNVDPAARMPFGVRGRWLGVRLPETPAPPIKLPANARQDFTFGSGGRFSTDGVTIPSSGFRGVPTSIGRRFGDTPLGRDPGATGGVVDVDGLRAALGSITAELKGQADVNVHVSVEPTSDFWAKVRSEVANAVGQLRVTAGGAGGTAGSTGRTMPEVGPAP